MNKRFPVLATIAVVLGVAGWLLVAAGVAGVLFAVYEGIIEPSQASPPRPSGVKEGIVLTSGFAAVFVGLLIVAFREIIGVLLAIEENTRTNRRLNSGDTIDG